MIGSVYKRGKTWTFVIDAKNGEDGRRRQITRGGFKTKREAVAAMQLLSAKQDQGIDVTQDKLTVREFLSGWIENHARLTVGPSTYVSYEQLIRLHILPVIGGVQLSRLTTLHVEGVYRNVLDRGRKPGTARLVHRCLHAALAYAVRNQLIGRNPASGTGLSRAPKYQSRTLTQEELGRLLSVTDSSSYATLVRLALETGAREGELLALRWANVDLTAGLIHIRATARRYKGKSIVFGPPKTEYSLRTLDLDPSAIALLQAHRASQLQQRLLAGAAYKNLDLVFATAFGTAIDAGNLERAWRKLMTKAGLPGFRFHDLRHTNATQLLANGERIEVVSRRLGHSGITITVDTYAHLLPEAGKAAAAKMAAVLNNATRLVSNPLAIAKDG